jgi:putative ABC transport system ATP-binding protein/macrolide transport system ATP-binding/permease protein/lipoprotein-releasing system ATP-binding protein
MILRAVGLRKSYVNGKTRVDAVDGADLTVAAGESISIVGRSGSGKSTLLAMIGALTRPTEGEILIAGERVWAMSEPARSDLRRQRIGFIFQFPSLLPNLRAIDNVALPALLGADIAPEAAYARAHDLLARVGLSRRVSAFPGEMSGGEQRRVALARALINGPQLLLADEPTSDLDEETEEEIVALLEALRTEEGFGLLLVTHNRDLAALADRTLEMRQGQLLAQDAAPVAARPVRSVVLPAPAKPEATVVAEAEGAEAFHRLGGHLWATFGRLVASAALAFGVAFLANEGVARYQRHQVEARGARLAALEELATSTLRSDIADITSLGDHRYDVTIYLENTKGEPAIYVMSPSVQAFVQVGASWQEAPLTPVAEATASVLKVTGRQLYKFVLELRVEKFTELLPHYMHVRFSNNMLVSPESTPKDELFQRNDNYFVYLKPDGLDDATILKDVHFPGAPPLWIWMPPH